jgi:hypothetical protein
VGFEPTVAFTTPVFKTGLFDHSSTPPGIMSGNIPEDKKMRNSYEVNSANDDLNNHMVDDLNGNVNILMYRSWTRLFWNVEIIHEPDDRMPVGKKSNAHFVLYPFERQLNGAKLHLLPEPSHSHDRKNPIAGFCREHFLNIMSYDLFRSGIVFGLGVGIMVPEIFPVGIPQIDFVRNNGAARCHDEVNC